MNKRITFILIFSVVTVSFFLNGVIEFFVIQHNLEKKTEEVLSRHVKSIESTIDLNRKETLKKLGHDINVANYVFYKNHRLMETGRKISFNTVNQITKKEKRVSVNQWLLNGRQLQYNYSYVDKIKELVGGTVTIFQRIDDGFVRISTNVLKKNKSRAVGTYIPSDSPVIKTILTGQRYYGRAYVVNDWYLTVYEPIWINGKIKGMLYVGVKEKGIENLRDTLGKVRIGETGYIVILNSEGKGVIHPNYPDRDFSNLDVVKRIKKGGNGIYYYEFEGKQKVCAVRYFEPYKWYLVLTINRHELISDLLSAIQFFTIIFSILLSTVIIFLIMKIFEYNENFLMTLLETIPIPVFYKNKNLIFNGCNREFEKFIHKDREEIIGCHIYSITDKETASVINSIDESILKKPGQQNHEITISPDDPGQRKQAIVSTAVYPSNDKIDGIIGVITDITEMKDYQDFLKEVSIRDELTGLYNRSGMKEIHEKIFSQAVRSRTHVSVIMVDIDYFKKFNDTYGHKEGDECLVRVSNAIKKTISRPLDIAIRYGGEEFLIILPNTNILGAERVSQKLKNNISDLNIKHEGSAIGTVTVSQGIYSKVPKSNDSLDNYINEADEMLYKAKESGRNTVCKKGEKSGTG